MQYQQTKTLALDFSYGRFDACYSYMSEDLVWEIIGENQFTGKEAVEAQCRQTAAYFDSVTTEFITEAVLADDRQVMVSGSAAFYRENKLLSFIKACDLYTFNETGQIVSIRSWCIPVKK